MECYQFQCQWQFWKLCQSHWWELSSFSCPFSLNCMCLISEKDSLRTDRDLDFFSDENIENVSTLERILKTFLILHPEFGEFSTCQSHKKSLPSLSHSHSLPPSYPYSCFLSSLFLNSPCSFSCNRLYSGDEWHSCTTDYGVVQWTSGILVLWSCHEDNGKTQ